MIDVSEVVADADLQAPQPFLILRSVGQFVAGGFQSTTTPIQAFGPVQRATPKEVEMMPEADRIKAIMNFWWTQPIYVTTGKAKVASTHGEEPVGAVPGTTYTLSEPPPGGTLRLYRNGLLQNPGADYIVSGKTLTLARPTVANEALFVTWAVIALVGTNAADIIQYPADGFEQYRILDVKHYPGSGYWKAAGTRMSAM